MAPIRFLLILVCFISWPHPILAKMDGVEVLITAEKKVERKTPPKKGTPKPSKPQERSINETRPLPPVIIIDPGHGGKDPGATSRYKIREKDLVLAVSKKLGASLKRKIGATVSLTRATDKFITLGERNRIANQKQCDLFLSVHANAAKSKNADGIEVYYLNRATDVASERLADRENEGSPKPEKEIEAILSDLIQAAATEESAELASDVERSLRRGLGKRYGIGPVRVKTALFYVLVGAKCPSLLIEIGFITNPQEARRLKKAGYQRDLTDAIAGGVASYLAGREKSGGDL